MRIHYPKLHNMAHSLSFECVHCFQMNFYLEFVESVGAAEDGEGWRHIAEPSSVVPPTTIKLKRLR